MISQIQFNTNCSFGPENMCHNKQKHQEQDQIPLQPATPARWKKDAVNQQLKELKMKKLNLFVVRPSDTREEVQKKLIKYLKQQGIKIVKEGKNEKN